MHATSAACPTECRTMSSAFSLSAVIGYQQLVFFHASRSLIQHSCRNIYPTLSEDISTLSPGSLSLVDPTSIRSRLFSSCTHEYSAFDLNCLCLLLLLCENENIIKVSLTKISQISLQENFVAFERVSHLTLTRFDFLVGFRSTIK